MFLILLYTTTDYPNSYVDINVILPAIRLTRPYLVGGPDRKIINVGNNWEIMYYGEKYGNKIPQWLAGALNKKYYKGMLKRTLKYKKEVAGSMWDPREERYCKDLTEREWEAKIIKILPDELTKLHATFEEFQNFYFYWELSKEIERVGYMFTKLFKLAMWNARKIKGKDLTYSEEARIYELFQGHRWISWKDSDNPEDPRLTNGFNKGYNDTNIWY